MNILILNFAVAGFAGDTKQPLLIAKGLIGLGHNVVYAVPDGDGYFFDENKSKSYAQIRKKLVDAKGEIIEIEGVEIEVGDKDLEAGLGLAQWFATVRKHPWLALIALWIASPIVIFLLELFDFVMSDGTNKINM